MRTLEGHPDFGVLEQRLIALIRRLKADDPAGPLAPVAIVAPTAALLAHLRRTLAAAFRGVLNLRFLHHEALIRDLTSAAGAGAPRALSDPVRQTILGTIIDAAGGPLAAYAKSRPGCIPALGSTFDDLREAGLEPEVDGTDLSFDGRELIRLYARYTGMLDRLAGRGLGDRAARARAALPHVAPYIGRFRMVIHYGAYELIGANLEILRAIEASGVPLAILVPYHPAAPAFALAGRFWPEMFRHPPDLLPDTSPGGRLLGDRLAGLYDEDTAPAPLPEGRAETFHARGASSELREVALRILVLHRDEGIPLHEIAVIARSLERYAPLLRPEFADCGLPFITTARLGGLREPSVQAALQLSRVVLGDYERQPLMDLLRGGRFQGGRPDAWRTAHHWDRLAREHRIMRGLTSWTRDLPDRLAALQPDPGDHADDTTRASIASFLEVQRRQAQSLAATVGALRRASLPLTRAGTWNGWSAALLALCRDHLRGLRPDDAGGLDPGAELVVSVLGDMADLDAAEVPFSLHGAMRHFERALADSSVPLRAGSADGSPGTDDNGGVRILDAMQARGLAFDAVFLIGFNADLIPQRPREDPWLDDRDRRRLRERSGRPLPIKAAARDEEHLLLAHLLGAARRRLIVSWQRADETGKARVPSLALREVARLTQGAADLGALLSRATRVPSHPGDAGRDAVKRHGLLPAAEARLNGALQLRSPGKLLENLPRLPPAPPAAPPADAPALESGLRMLSVVEDFAATDLKFDAFVGGDRSSPSVWSPSRLETLGACPQQYFFRHVLQVREPAEPTEGFEIPPEVIGQSVHRVLQDIYEGLLEPWDDDHRGGESGAAERALVRADAGLDEAWARHTEDLARAVSARYPLLWESVGRGWLDALRSFIRQDIPELFRNGVQLTGLERTVSTTLTLGAKRRSLAVRGRLDRVGRIGDAGVIVADYKTSGRPDKHVDMASLLRGQRLQMPLYALLAESPSPGPAAPPGSARAEVLGVGPRFVSDRGDWDPETGRSRLDPEKFARHRGAFEETLVVLADLAGDGSFPLNASSLRCEYCPYRRACRRGHPPTLSRLEQATGGKDYALVQRKHTRAPTLEAVRAARAPENNG